MNQADPTHMTSGAATQNASGSIVSNEIVPIPQLELFNWVCTVKRNLKDAVLSMNIRIVSRQYMISYDMPFPNFSKFLGPCKKDRMYKHYCRIIGLLIKSNGSC